MDLAYCVANSPLLTPKEGITPCVSPQMVLSLLSKHRLPFSASLLTNPTPTADTDDAATNAILFGLQSTELIYLSYYQQWRTAEKIHTELLATAEKLGIASLLKDARMDSLRSHWASRQELFELMSSRLMQINRVLQRMERHEVYVLTVGASWVECTRIIAHLAMDTHLQELRNLLAEQQYALQNLNGQMADYVYLAPAVMNLYMELEKINLLYAETPIFYTYSATQTDTANHMTTIENHMQVSMSDAQVKALADALDSVKVAIIP